MLYCNTVILVMNFNVIVIVIVIVLDIIIIIIIVIIIIISPHTNHHHHLLAWQPLPQSMYVCCGAGRPKVKKYK